MLSFPASNKYHKFKKKKQEVTVDYVEDSEVIKVGQI